MANPIEAKNKRDVQADAMGAAAFQASVTRRSGARQTPAMKHLSGLRGLGLGYVPKKRPTRWQGVLIRSATRVYL